jgi:hypothetical protein
MTSVTKRVLFEGLDPAPVSLTIAADASEEDIFAAACMPSSVFLQAVRPYRVLQQTSDTCTLVIGPEGYGAVLLEALQWMARVTAAGIVGNIAGDQVRTFVRHYLEQQRPDWRFEELTEHAEVFIDDRYRRASDDATYRQTLEAKRHDTELTTWVIELRTWAGR